MSLKASLLTGLAVSVLAVSLAYINFLGNLERSTLDLLFQLRGAEHPSDQIYIIGITEDCLEEIGRWPWDRNIHAVLLEILTEGGVQVVGMDIIFAEPSYQTWMDDDLVDASRRAPAVICPLDAPPVSGQIVGFFTPSKLTCPFPELEEVVSSGFINVTPDQDGILRRAIMLMEYHGEPVVSFSVLIWSIYNNLPMDLFYANLQEVIASGHNNLSLGEFDYPLDGGGRTLINFSGGPNNFLVLPYHLVIGGQYSASTFQDKIVLVGFFASGLGDYYFTPFSKDTPMFGVELHANILDMFLRTGPIYSLPLWLNLLLVFSLGFFSMLLYRLLHPVIGFVSFVVLAAVFFFITLQLFIRSSLYVESVYSLLALTGSYIGSLGCRYIVEQRDRQRVTRLFGRYVAPEVVDEILSIGEENLKLGGVRRNVTLLFIDIRGFTPLSERLSPEEVVSILNRYFDIVTRCIFDNKGTIDKFMGDAAMAVFNAPLLLEDHALWALKAAKAIIEEGVELQREIDEMYSVELSFGIGINTGEAVVGNIGAMNRMEYTAIGDTVNLAARLESNAKPGQVLVSESVFREVAGKMPLEPVGKIPVKGKSKPVMVYQLASDATTV